MSKVISTDSISVIEGAEDVFKTEPESEHHEIMQLEESEDPLIKVDRTRLRSYNGNEPEVFSIAKIENMDYEHSFEDRHTNIKSSSDNEKDKSNECDICFNTFATSSSLKTHKRTHTGKKPYECDVCAKMFTTASTLWHQKRIHTGKKP